MEGIGFKNMKVFKENQFFDFKKLTLFTGTNNSGKSSVISAMQMLQESIQSKDLQELLKTEIRVTTNQNKHGSLLNFVNNESEGDLSNKFRFSLQKGGIIFDVNVEINEGLQSHGVVQSIIASDKNTKERIFWIIPVDLDKEFECNFNINYKYFLNRFYQKCENTIRLREKTAILDKLVELVKKDKADVKELRELADKLSKEFSVYININYCHYSDSNFDIMTGVSIEDGKVHENSKQYKDSKTSIVSYRIEQYDRHGDSPNQYVEELGVLFSERKRAEVGESDILHQPKLYSKEEIDSLYSNSSKDGIFDFSFLWKEDKSNRANFEQLICAYYGADFKIARRRLSDDLITVLSSERWNMKEKYRAIYGEVNVPSSLLQKYFANLQYFGLIAEMFSNAKGNSFTPNRNLVTKSSRNYENEDIKRIMAEGFFEKIYDELSDLIRKFIEQKNHKIPELNDSMSFEEKIDIISQKYSIYEAQEPLVHAEAYDWIEKDMAKKLLNVNLCFKNEYVSSNRFSIQRTYSFNDQTDFSKLLEQVEKLKGKAKITCNEFINKWIKIFGIADKLILKPDSDTGNFKAYLVKNNIETSLADFGLGTNQLLPVIFALAIHKKDWRWEESLSPNQYFNRTVVIEEPEANLHPALQSKLADMFVDAINKFGVQIIAETHSEYLIRRLQYLTAKHYYNPSDIKGSISAEDSVIYYFNQDKDVNAKEPKVVKIEITDGGNLTDTFGKGFFDEATTLKFDLIRLNKNQFN